ncbi:FecR family protein [Flavobacterium sp.]|uniref:FecR family protein n=1 Tax=Flavobacterium sp. TaxID=239 RepID=UPI00286BA111|nr:FecR family protein [Flavobacterium sp.]
MDEDYKLTKWLDNSMNEAELSQFKASDHYVVFEKIKKYSSQLETNSFDQDKMLAEVLVAPKEKTKIIPLYKTWVFRMAACIVLLLSLTFVLKTNVTATEIAQNGQKKSFELPDNSEVVLNSGSEIVYKKWNWDNNRKLNLNGEAYFKVTKGKTFEVATPLGKVTILGTQFNVKSRESRFDVTCYEGRVRVNYNNTEIIITKGMRVAFENNKKIIIPNTEFTQPKWINNEITFDKENLNTIIKEINRQYNIEIILKNTAENLLFTGTIPSNNLESALEIIDVTYHLQHKKVSDNKFILEPLNVKK